MKTFKVLDCETGAYVEITEDELEQYEDWSVEEREAWTKGGDDDE